MGNGDAVESPPDSSLRQRLAATALYAVGGGAFFLAITARLIANANSLGPWFFYTAVGVYLLGAIIIPRRIVAFHPHAHFGLANTLTLIRLVLACLLAGFAVEISLGGDGVGGWLLFILAVVSLLLDGLDGLVARRSGLSSAFGARFDMEVDAFLILVLSVLVLVLGKAGPWVLAGGLMRYAYIAAGMIWPVLNDPLPPSFRRKTIAVVQGAALTALLAPMIQPPLSTLTAAAALILLIYSFGIDVATLIRAQRS